MNVWERPCARIDALPTTASGKLETKIAASRAMPPVPSPRATPGATFPGTPSRVTAVSRAERCDDCEDARCRSAA